MTFEQTKVILNKALKIVKLCLFVFGIITQLVYLAYLAYAIFAPLGNQWLNIPLGIVCAVYFVFYCVTENIKATKRVRNVTRRMVRFFKFLARVLTIVMMVYSIYNIATDITLMSVILTVLMIVGCIVLVIFEILAYIIERRIKQLVKQVSSNVKSMVESAKRWGIFTDRLSTKSKAPLVEPTLDLDGPKTVLPPSEE